MSPNAETLSSRSVRFAGQPASQTRLLASSGQGPGTQWVLHQCEVNGGVIKTGTCHLLLHSLAQLRWAQSCPERLRHCPRRPLSAPPLSSSLLVPCESEELGEIPSLLFQGVCRTIIAQVPPTRGLCLWLDDSCTLLHPAALGGTQGWG